MKMVKIENTKVVLIHCNMADNDYQQNSRVLYKFIQNRLFGQLLDVLPKNAKTNCSYIEVSFSDKNFKPLVIENKINITLVIN